MPLLPVNLDTTYADDGADASVKLHQQHHDQLHLKANFEVDVKADFGAVGDGTADDTTAFTNANNAIPFEGGVIRIPRGRYKVGSITLKPRTWYLGLGSPLGIGTNAGAVIEPLAANQVTFKIEAGAGMEHDGPIIENLCFRSTLNGVKHVRLQGVNRWTIRNCRFEGNSALTASANYGIDAPGAPTNDNAWWHIEQCSFRSLTFGAHFGDQNNGGTVLGGEVSDCGTGIYVRGGGTTIIGVKFDVSDRSAADTKGVGIWVNGGNQCVMIGNRFERLNSGTATGILCDIISGDQPYQGDNNVIIAPSFGGTHLDRGVEWSAESNNNILMMPVQLSSAAGFAMLTDAGSFNTYVDGVNWKIAAGYLGKVGFFGTAPIVKATVTGSRGGNAALASLLTTLANYGLITNSTT